MGEPLGHALDAAEHVHHLLALQQGVQECRQPRLRLRSGLTLVHSKYAAVTSLTLALLLVHLSGLEDLLCHLDQCHGVH